MSTISASRATSPCSIAWRISARSSGVPRSIAISSGSVGLPSRRSSPTFLPSCSVVAFVVEQVVDQLERGAERAAVVGARLLDLGVGLGEHGAQARARLEQLGGLEADDAQVVVDRDVGVVHVHQLQHFAFGDHVGRVGQHLEHAHAVHRRPSSGRRASRGSRRPARWRRCRTARWRSARPRRSADSSTTSSCSSVAVWMNSTIAASSKRSRPGEAERAGEQQHQQRPDALAAGADDVVARSGRSARPRRPAARWMTASTCAHVGGHRRAAAQGQGRRGGEGGRRWGHD